MTKHHNTLEMNWHDQLLAAVSPFESGVQSLQINGYRPRGTGFYRPNKTAAVLVALLDLDEPEVVLTRRADHLLQHAGQVSFPGGAVEDHDASAVQTALREAFEEIGLPPGRTKPIGFLDRMDTISDYRILPVVALVEWPIQWKLDYSEVAEVFTVPLSIAIDRGRYSEQRVKREDQEYTTRSMQWKNHTIWGVTAAMLLNLASRMENAGAR
ncbi:MAG TPA: CoA pyrophosphatase [Xanthomonadales bacterium]|nr:CoA pyrophosphatase [Xanthomonadales bacterium]